MGLLTDNLVKRSPFDYDTGEKTKGGAFELDPKSWTGK